MVAVVLGLLAIGTLVAAGPMTWLLMLALGNLGHPQFGFVDCLPMALFVAWAFGCARSEK